MKESLLTPPSATDRNKRRLMVGCIGALLVFVAFFGLATVGMRRSDKLKESQPYQLAIRRIKEDANVLGMLGPSIRDDYATVRGEVNILNDRGNASLEFRIAGKSRHAQVRLLASRTAGVWKIDVLEITPDGMNPTLIEDLSPLLPERPTQ